MRLGQRWFEGSADAIYQNLNLVYDERPDTICVFGADHIYRMDPRQMIDQHIEGGAGVTVAAIRVPIDAGGRVRRHRDRADDGRDPRFHEKPASAARLARRARSTCSRRWATTSSRPTC